MTDLFNKKGLLYIANLSNIVIYISKILKLIQVILEKVYDILISDHQSIKSMLKKFNEIIPGFEWNKVFKNT